MVKGKFLTPNAINTPYVENQENHQLGDISKFSELTEMYAKIIIHYFDRVMGMKESYKIQIVHLEPELCIFIFFLTKIVHKEEISLKMWEATIPALVHCTVLCFCTNRRIPPAP